MGTCARKLVSAISTIKSMGVLLPVERNQERRTLRLRVVAKQEKEVAQLIAHLGPQMPRQSNPVNMQCGNRRKKPHKRFKNKKTTL